MSFGATPVQATGASTTTNGGATSITATFGSGVATGNAVFVNGVVYNPTTSAQAITITDQKGNVYTQQFVSNNQQYYTGLTYRQFFSYLLIVPAGSNGTALAITLSTTPATYMNLAIEERTYTGGSVAIDNNTTSAATGNGTAVATTSVAITGSGPDLLFAMCEQNLAVVTITAGTGFTSDYTVGYTANQTLGFMSAYKANITSSQTTTFTLGSPGDNWVAAACAYNLVAASGVTATITGPSPIATSKPATFTVSMSGSVTTTLSWSDGAGGTFSPSSNSWSASSASQTFTYTPAAAGTPTITGTASPAIGNTPTLSVTVRNSANYYVDPVNGNDGNSGMTGSPWQTKTAVNAFSFVAGDTIGLNGGSTVPGPLLIGSSGVSGSPVTITSYGTGEATVGGSAFNLTGIQVLNSPHVYVTNLNFLGSVPTGSGKSLATTSTGYAIEYLSTLTSGSALQDIKIDNCACVGFLNGIMVHTPVGGYCVFVVNVNATAGTFTITVGGQTTGSLNYNASLATVQAAVVALSTVGTGNCTVVGNVGYMYICEFASGLGALTCSANTSAITGYPYAYTYIPGGVNAVVGYNNVSITNCTVHQYYKQGIYTQGSASNAGANSFFPVGQGTFTNVYVANNDVGNNSGDPRDGLVATTAIQCLNCTGLVIEYNAVHDVGATGWLATGPTFLGGEGGIVAMESYGAIIQFNEVWNIHCPITDGLGLDQDGGTQQGYIRYNAVHDCDRCGIVSGSYSGTGVSTFGPNFIHHNLSYRNCNATSGSLYPDLLTFGSNNLVVIANNTSYLNTAYGANAAAWNIQIQSNQYALNNIFVSIGCSNNLESTGGHYIGNCYWATTSNIASGIASLAAWQATGQEKLDGQLYGAFGDPLFSNPAGGWNSAGNGSQYSGNLQTMPYFNLSSGSAAIGCGVNISAALSGSSVAFVAPARDFSGKSTTQNRGATTSSYDAGAISYGSVGTSSTGGYGST